MIEIILEFFKNNLFAVITAVVAIIALFQTQKQIKLSNKQFLFDSRLNKYLLSKSLIELYKEHKKLLDYSNNSDDEAIIVDLQFEMLTNIRYLKDITCLINDPKNNEYKNNFLLKIEEMNKLSNEIKFLFPHKTKLLFLDINKNYLSEFVLKYKNVLVELYKYQIVLYNMENDKIPRKKNLTYIELQKEYDEINYRYRLYKAIDELNTSYEKVIENKTIAKIEKLIKL